MKAQGSATKRVADRVLNALRRHPELLQGGPLVLGVSGGADSLALLWALSSLPPTTRPDLIVAHFSHGMRPSTERREAALVRRLAAEAGAPFAHGRAGDDRALMTEAAARAERYRFLLATAQAHGASCAVVAHTMDDQAETVLLRLTRGAGLRGLAGMRELSAMDVDAMRLTIFRPLLRVARKDTVAVCAEAGWTPVRDGSNRLLRFARNRVRRRVIPELRAVNDAVVEALAGAADRADSDESFLTDAAREAIAGAETRLPGEVSWRKARLVALPDALAARVLLDAWRHLCGEASALSAREVGALDRLVHAPSGGELALRGGMRFVVEQDVCRLTRVPAETGGHLPETPLAVPGETLFGHWLVQARFEPPGRGQGGGVWCAVLDVDRLGPHPAIRTRRSGDRFQPVGMDRVVRLQDLLVNARVPRGQRAGLPLIIGEQGIAWAPGVRVAAWAAATPATRQAVAVSVRRAEATG